MLLAGVVVGVVLGGIYSGVPARGQEPAHPDVLTSLLVEVRALRSAIEQMATAGARVQVAMGRLQLQEQRVNTLTRRLDELRRSIASDEREAVEREGELARLEESMPAIADATERQAIEQRIRQLKSRLARASADIQRQRAEETDLAAVVSAEQARWTDINQQLEELDRVLRRQ
jgi:predicted  nucleic acid-binding Zn-ribbon protein